LLYQNNGCTKKSNSGTTKSIGDLQIFYDPCSAARALMSLHTLASLKSEYEAIATAAMDQPPLPVSPKENSTVPDPFKVEFEAVMPFHVVTPCQRWQFEVETMFISSDLTAVSSQSPYAVYAFGAYGGDAQNNFLCRGKSTLIANLKSGRNQFRIRAKSSDGRETPWSLWFGFDVPEKTLDKEVVGNQPLQQAPTPPGLDPDQARALMPEGDGQSLPIDADAALGKKTTIRPPPGSEKLTKENDGSPGIPDMGRDKIVAGSAVDGQNGLNMDPAQVSLDPQTAGAIIAADSPFRLRSPAYFMTLSPVEGREYNARLPLFIKTVSPGQTEIQFILKRLDPDPQEIESWTVLLMQEQGNGLFVYQTSKAPLPEGQYLLQVGPQSDEQVMNYDVSPHRRFSVVSKPLPIGDRTIVISGQPAADQSGDYTQRSGQGPTPGAAVLEEKGKAVTTATGGKVPKIVRPAFNQVVAAKAGEEKCIDVEIAHLPSVVAYKNNPINSMITWNVYIDWQYSPTPESLFSSLETVNQTPAESNAVKNYCLATGRYKIRAWAKEREIKQEGDGWVEEFKNYYGQWQQFSIAALQVDKKPVVDSAALSGIALSKQQSQVTTKSMPGSPLATPMVKKGMEPLDLPAPKLIPLPRNQRYLVNSLAGLPVRHAAGQKPAFEFEYFDKKGWRKTESIRSFSMQTPKGGRGLVVTQAKFRLAQPGKYRYRVKTGNKFSSYQTFMVVGPQGSLSPQMGTAGKGAAAGTAISKQKVAQPAQDGSAKTAPKSSANELRGSDSTTPKVAKQLQPARPVLILSPKHNQSFWAPANVTVTTSHDSRIKLRFALSRNNGSFIKMRDGKLENLSAGNYKIRVRYDTKGIDWQEVSFNVRPPVKKKAVQQQPKPQALPQTQPVPKSMQFKKSVGQ
ncbi:MAG: hypothetical protein KJO32_04995, partial [Deltaproteobacteria bacterium]|nr:hypothetical protein [Deltaproteobacteria bacterium]